MSAKPSETPKPIRTIEEIAEQDAVQVAAKIARMKLKPEACQECRFHRAVALTDAMACHRYPEHLRVHPNHWCGEFDRKRGEA